MAVSLLDRTPKRQPQNVSFAQRIRRFPPILVRLLARHRGGLPLSTVEIATRSGLTPPQVEAISQATSWVGIDIPTFLSFTAACNLDLTKYKDVKRAYSYLMGRVVNGVHVPVPFRYLKRSIQWESYYKPMMERFLESLQSQR